MKKTIKKIISVLLVALVLVNLTGCKIVLGIRKKEVKKLVEAGEIEEGALGTGLGSAGAQPKEEKQLSGSLKLQVFTNESEKHNEAWTNVVTAFEDVTGVKVTLIMGSQVNTQYSAAWLAGEAPADIVWINGNGIADEEMEASGVFYDLSEVLKEGYIYGTDAKISDRLNMEVVRERDGGMYRAPLMTSVQGMWYDRRCVPEAPVNFEEYLAVSKELSDQGIAGMTYPGIYSDYTMWALLMPAAAAYGEEFFLELAAGKPEAFQDERFKEVLNRYVEYCEAGNVLKGSTSADHTTSQLNWLNNKAGFITNGLWLEAEMQDYIPAEFEMAFCASPLITAEQTPTLVLHSNNVAVAEKTENLENALAFIRFLYRDDVQLEFMSQYSYLSALTSIDYEDAELTDVARDTMDYINSGKVNVVNCNVSWDGLVNNTFKIAINDLAVGNRTVDEVCDALTEDAKR